MEECCNYCGAIGEILIDNDGIEEVHMCPRCFGSGLSKPRNVKSKLTIKEFFNKHMPESKLIDLARKCFKN